MSRKWIFVTLVLPLLAALCSVSAQNVTPPAVQPAPAPAKAVEPKLSEPPSPPPPTPLPPTQLPPTQLPPTQLPPTQLPLTQPPFTQPPPAASNDESRQTIIIRLQHVRSDGAVQKLRLLLEGDDANDVNVATDDATNSIILRGKKRHLDEIEAVLKQLDTEPAKLGLVVDGAPALRYSTLAAPVPVPPTPSPNTALVRPPQTVTYQTIPSGLELRYSVPSAADAKLAQEYAQLEKQALQVAGTIRGEKKADGQQTEQERKKLTEIVQQAFDKRQQMQEQEVKQLKERLEKIESALAKRTEHRDDIINKRVKELLDEDRELNWDGAARSPGSAQAVTLATDPYSPAAVRTTTPKGLPQAPRYTTQPAMTASPYRAAQVNPNVVELTPGSNPAVVASPASAASINLLKAEAEVSQAEMELKQSEELLSKKAIAPAQHEYMTAKLKQAKAQRDFIRRELETQLRLLELDMESAKSKLEVAQQALDTAAKQHESGVVSSSELLKLRGDAEQAQYQLLKARAMHDLYRSAVPRDEAKPETPKR